MFRYLDCYIEFIAKYAERFELWLGRKLEKVHAWVAGILTVILFLTPIVPVLPFYMIRNAYRKLTDRKEGQ